MKKNFGGSEILSIAEAVAREKNIPKDSVIEALEEAIKVAARSKYGHESVIKAEIDRKTGEVKLSMHKQVVSEEELARINEEEAAQLAEPDKSKRKKKEVNYITLAEAKLIKPDANVGDLIIEPLPPIDLGRVSAQSAKQVIIYKVKETERERNYEEFKDRIGKIVSGIVANIENWCVLVKIGTAEAVIPNDQLIRDERNRLKQGERIRAVVCEIKQESRGPQIVLSRTNNQFLAELFAQEVPEIYDRIIEIKAIARDPGLRSKIAVFTSDPSIDPVGSCVGMKGARVQAVINELGGERIDIIPWSSDPANLVVSALAPAEVSKVIIDEDNKRIEVVVPDEQLSIAIGKRGQNVRLASALVGWNIDVMTEDAESKRRSEEFEAITSRFMTTLDLEEILAQLLVSEGFNSIADIANASVADIASIEGLDEAIAEELINRASEYASTHTDAYVVPVALSTALSKLDAQIRELPGMNDALLIKLYEAKLFKLVDIADLARDEFIEKIPDSGLSENEIDAIIMAARNKVYFSA